MALATWWRGDVLPTLIPIPDFHVEIPTDRSLIAHVTGLGAEQVRKRLGAGHVPYLAYIADEPVGYGWLAQHSAEIGELCLSFALPPTDRYLWDFATLPAWQGYGIYPRLLQSILTQQPRQVKRVWIIYAPENTPSGMGMHKAGLAPVGQLSFRIEGGVGLLPSGEQERAQGAADLLGVPVIEHLLAPCWSCGSKKPAPSIDVDVAGCWPPVRRTAAPCSCAVEVKPGRIVAGT